MTASHRSRPVVKALRTAAVFFAALSCAACGAAAASGPQWPPLAKKWYERAQGSYRHADIEDAQVAVENALRLMPKEPEVRVLAARVALATLDYDRVVQLLEGIDTTEARAIRGRALWYSNRTDRAADELEKLLTDPEVRDQWAAETVKLARRGAGRDPFKMSGGLLAVSEMPRVNASSLIVPLEVNGEPALALIATNVPEAVIDSSAGGEPSWISLRFAERVEVDDVPALAQDLSGVSRQLNTPIKMLLGVNVLRHLRPTVDHAGSQFVVRTFDPPPPPQATTVKLSYLRGGGMVMRSALRAEETAPLASLLVDTSMVFPLALDDDGWNKAGVSLDDLEPVPNGGSLKQGMVSLMRVGAFEVPQVPGVSGASTAELEKNLGVDLDGFVGAGLLAAFRVTLVDGGRTMWLEDMPAVSAPGPAGEPTGEGPADLAPSLGQGMTLQPPPGAGQPGGGTDEPAGAGKTK